MSRRCRSWRPLPGQAGHGCLPESCSTHWRRCRAKRGASAVRCQDCWDALTDPAVASDAVRRMIVVDGTVPDDVLAMLSLDPSETVRFYADSRLAD